MASISIPAAIGAVGSLAGGIIQGQAAGSAARTQAQAAQQAAAQQMQMFNVIQGNMQPYMAGGPDAALAIRTGLGLFNPEGGGIGPIGTGSLIQGPMNIAGVQTSLNPTMATLENLPGYQFSLNQGLKSTQNSYAAQGLGGSGAAMKGAASFAEGLAGTNWQNYFQNWLDQQRFALGQQQQQFTDQWTAKENQLGMLTGVAGNAQNASANLGSMGQSATNQATNYLTSGAAASAAGTVGAANATTNALGGIGSSITGAIQAPYILSAMSGGMYGPAQTLPAAQTVNPGAAGTNAILGFGSGQQYS